MARYSVYFEYMKNNQRKTYPVLKTESYYEEMEAFVKSAQAYEDFIKSYEEYKNKLKSKAA